MYHIYMGNNSVLYCNAYLFIAVISTGETPDLLCTELRDPRWGSVRINFNVEISTYEAIYRCEPGRSLNGGRRRFCNENNGMWSGQEPTCIPGMHSILYLCVGSVTIFSFTITDEMLNIYINGLSGGQGEQRKRRQEEGTKSMEIMVFVDSGVVGFHGSDIIVNYILAIMNIVSITLVVWQLNVNVMHRWPVFIVMQHWELQLI